MATTKGFFLTIGKGLAIGFDAEVSVVGLGTAVFSIETMIGIGIGADVERGSPRRFNKTAFSAYSLI